jgi:hypothetical protein
MMESLLMSRPTVIAGKFSLPSVKPGEYTIAVRGASQSDAAAAAPAGAGRGGPLPAMTLWASADISVNGVDLSDIVLRLQPGVDIAGASRSMAPPRNPRISPPSRCGCGQRRRQPHGLGRRTAAPVNADGTFVLKGVTPGRYFVSSYVPGGSITPVWTMRSARVGEIDAGDVPFEVGSGRDPADISVTFTTRSASCQAGSSMARTSRRRSLSIILFPTDKAIVVAVVATDPEPVRPANDGVQIRDILAGEYTCRPHRFRDGRRVQARVSRTVAAWR